MKLPAQSRTHSLLFMGFGGERRLGARLRRAGGLMGTDEKIVRSRAGLNLQWGRNWGRCQGRSQYEANRGTRLGKILPNTVDFYFFYQTDNIRRFHTADFVQRTVCSPRL